MDLNIRRVPSALWFAVAALSAWGVASLLAPQIPATEPSDLLATAIAIDLVIVVPALFYLTLVRGRGWPEILLAPVFLGSYALTGRLLPTENQQFLHLLGYAVPAIEIGVLAWVGIRAWKIIRDNRKSGVASGDFYDGIRAAIGDAFPAPQLGAAIAYELSLFHYALALPRRGRSDDSSIGYLSRTGYSGIFGAILLAALAELGAVHLLLRGWHEVAVWIHVGLSLYGILWLVGDYRAMHRRPHLLLPDAVRVRTGIRWDAVVRADNISGIRRTMRAPEGDERYLNAVPLGGPHFVLELREPVEATGPYGVRKRFLRVGIAVDQEQRLVDWIEAQGLQIGS